MRLAAILVLVFFFVLSVTAQVGPQMESAILGRLANLEKWSNYGEESDYEKLEKENASLRADILRLGRAPATIEYLFPKLKGKMYVVTSKDGRLRIYSWDRETGGTMHDFDSVYQYRGDSGKVYTWADTREEDSGGVFYHEIFQVDTRSKPIYLTISTFIGSTSFAGQNVDAVRILGERLDTKAKVFRTAKGTTHTIGFPFDFFSVVDRPERPVMLFKYDAIKRQLSFPVVIEDDATPQGRVTEKMITYRFKGYAFVKVS